MPEKLLKKLAWWSALWIFGAMVVSLMVQQPVQTALADDTPVWPVESTQIGMNQNLNVTWGTAVSSDINWVYDTEGDMPFTNVIVVNGLAYVGGMMNSFYALDAITGQLAWKFDANNWIMTNPIVVNGVVYIGSGNRDYQSAPSKGGIRGTGSNSLYALDAKTGKQIWKYDVVGEAMPTPLYHDGLIYYVTGDRNLYALDAASGNLVYKQDLGSIFSMGSINIDGDIMVFGGGFPFKVFGFNLKTRQMAWETPFPNVYLGLDDSNPAIANGMMYINGVTYDTTADGPKNPRQEFFALNTQTGELKWTHTAGIYSMPDDNKSSTPVVVDGVYYGASSLARNFSALDATTGAIKWQFNIGQVVKGGPVVTGNFVIFADTKGNVYTLNRTTGKLIKKLALGGNIAPQGPTLFNGTVYIANQGNGKLYAFSLTTLTGLTLRTPEAVPATLPAGSVYFKETGHLVSGSILTYWNTHGGLPSIGFPITGPIQEFHAADGKTYTVQYFERARLELHPEFAGTPYEVLMGRLGSEDTINRRGEASFQPIAKPASGVFYSQTGHTVLPEFDAYWQQNGGLARFGYPISEPKIETNSSGDTVMTQWFERARFELHGTSVLLGLIGNERLVFQGVK